MPIIQHTVLRPFGYALFEAAGLPTDQAKVAMDHLVDANLTGHDSHGVIRTPGYVRGVHSGNIKPAGNHKIVRETPTSMTIDANKSFGIVLCNQAMQWAVDRAKEYTFGAVAVHQSSHIGRPRRLSARRRRARLYRPPHAQRRRSLGRTLRRNGTSSSSQPHRLQRPHARGPTLDARYDNQYGCRRQNSPRPRSRRAGTEGMARRRGGQSHHRPPVVVRQKGSRLPDRSPHHGATKATDSG